MLRIIKDVSYKWFLDSLHHWSPFCTNSRQFSVVSLEGYWKAESNCEEPVRITGRFVSKGKNVRTSRGQKKYKKIIHLYFSKIETGL